MRYVDTSWALPTEEGGHLVLGLSLAVVVVAGIVVLENQPAFASRLSFGLSSWWWLFYAERSEGLGLETFETAGFYMQQPGIGCWDSWWLWIYLRCRSRNLRHRRKTQMPFLSLSLSLEGVRT